MKKTPRCDSSARELLSVNLARQMVCYTEPSEKLSLETDQKGRISPTRSARRPIGQTICPSVTVEPISSADGVMSEETQLEGEEEKKKTTSGVILPLHPLILLMLTCRYVVQRTLVHPDVGSWTVNASLESDEVHRESKTRRSLCNVHFIPQFWVISVSAIIPDLHANHPAIR